MFVLCVFGIFDCDMAIAATYGGFEYEKAYDLTNSLEEYVYITGYTGSDEEIIIPKTIEGTYVTSIASNAFSECDTITKITIPDSVTTIKNSAFYGCESLIEVILPNSITSIEMSAFSKCSSLREISIPSGLTSIEYHLFEDCDNLGKISIPNSVTTIGSGAFYDCDALEEMMIPYGVTVIDSYVFYSCDNLMNVKIPNSVTTINDGAFSDCDSLKEITIPDSVTLITGSILNDCDNLTTIYANKDTAGYREAKRYVTEVLPISSEFSVAKKNTVLSDVKNKCEVKVTSTNETNPTVTYLRSTNGKAKSVMIPDTVMVNGITYNVTSVAANAMTNNKKVTKVIVGKNVITIGKNAFKNCKNIKSVILKSTKLKSIGANTFYGCKSLKTITIKSTKITKKSIGKNAFKGTNKKLIIKVPKGKVNSYKKFLKNKGNKNIKVKKG